MSLYGIALHVQQFWKTYPALWYGLFFYVGATYSIAPTFSQIILVLFLLLPTLVGGRDQKVPIAFALLCCGFSYIYVSTTITLGPKSDDELFGKALLQVEQVTSDYRYGKSFYKLDLLIKQFIPTSKDGSIRNLPCKLTLDASRERPQGGFEYEVSGKLCQKKDRWIFTPFPNSGWKPTKSFFSLVEYRYKAKKKLVQLLSSIFAPSTVRSFLEGVLVGEFHDTMLKACLQRFGLQHILVVSGFHFALLVAIFASLIRIFTRSQLAFIILLILTTFYFLFIGPSASVLRAYTAASACLFGKLLQRDSSGINALGLGLMLIVWLEPLWCIQVGFQLSFLATWAILLLFPIIQKLLFSFWPRYSLQVLSEANFFEQAVFVLSTFFLSALALILAVTLFCLPMTLYAFGQFPVWGIFYNLFFPFGVSFAISCVCLGFLFYPLAYIANFFWSLGALVLELFLTLVEHVPRSLDIVLTCTNMPAEVLVFYLCALSFVGIACRIDTEKVKNL